MGGAGASSGDKELQERPLTSTPQGIRLDPRESFPVPALLGLSQHLSGLGRLCRRAPALQGLQLRWDLGQGLPVLRLLWLPPALPPTPKMHNCPATGN